MQAFLVLGLPLGFLLLVLTHYPREELLPTRRSYLLGLTASVPVFLVARIPGLFLSPAYGSILLVVHEWVDRILPYSILPIVAYLAFYRFRRDPHTGESERRITAFHAGALSPVGLGEMARTWGNPEPYELLLLPFLLSAIVLAMPYIALKIHESSGFRLFFLVFASILGSLVLSFCPWLFLARLWPLAWLLTAAACFGAWVLANPALVRCHPPRCE